MDDGFATIITFANIPSVRIFEKEVTPPGIQAGGAVDTTTMRNTTWRTQSPKRLKTLTPVTTTVAYATEAYSQIFAVVGVLQEITVTFPDHSTIKFWGWIDEFTPASNTEGEQPTASMTIQPSNHDLDGVESAPVYTDPAETT